MSRTTDISAKTSITLRVQISPGEHLTCGMRVTHFIETVTKNYEMRVDVGGLYTSSLEYAHDDGCRRVFRASLHGTSNEQVLRKYRENI